MTPAMERALRKAMSRERANICPIIGCWANAEQMLIEAMDRRGFIVWDHPEGFRYGDGNFVHHGAPRISEKGRLAIADLEMQRQALLVKLEA